MPNYIVSKITDALNKNEKCLKNSKILILGIAYKKDTDDIRESPALELMKILEEKGVKIYYNDPYVDQIPKLRKYNFNLKSSPLSKNLLKKMDVVLIVTDHSSYNYEWIVENSKLIVDTRNATSNIKTNKHKVIKA